MVIHVAVASQQVVSSSVEQPTTTITFFWNIAKRDKVGAAPSRVQMIAVECQRAFAAWTADTWFERHLVTDLFCEPHETKNPHWNPTLLYRHLGDFWLFGDWNTTPNVPDLNWYDQRSIWMKSAGACFKSEVSCMPWNLSLKACSLLLPKFIIRE
jgi:hypothetical protein